MAYDILYVRIDHLQIQLQILCISWGLFLPFAAQPNLPYHNPTLQTICFDTKAKHATSWKLSFMLVRHWQNACKELCQLASLEKFIIASDASHWAEVSWRQVAKSIAVLMLPMEPAKWWTSWKKQWKGCALAGHSALFVSYHCRLFSKVINRWCIWWHFTSGHDKRSKVKMVRKSKATEVQWKFMLCQWVFSAWYTLNRTEGIYQF